MSMDLEAAQAVVNAHRQAEQEKVAARQRLLIGRSFKYHNSYGDGDRWWLYALVTSVNEWGHLSGWSFQHTSHDEVRVERGTYLNIQIDSGWKEIDPAEFWSAARALSVVVTAQLAGPEGVGKRAHDEEPT